MNLRVGAGLLASVIGIAGCADAEPASGERAAPSQQTASASPAVPTSFGLTGCGLPAVCQAKAAGSGWEATCGTLKLTGADASSLSGFSLPDGRSCTGSVAGGVLKGACTGTDAGAPGCSFESSTPSPSPYCAQIPARLTKLDACSAPPSGAQNILADSCEVVQHECRYQATCSGGLTFSGPVTPTGLIYDTPSNYRCNATLEGGKLSGTCTQRAVPDGGTPGSCAIAAEAPATASASCRNDLPEDGFVLEGCGHQGTVCTVVQRGCLWQATCGKDVYRARIEEPGVYPFTLANGAACKATVKDGVFSGSCGEGERACTLRSVPPKKPSGCLTLPPMLGSNGCGGDLSCKVQQSGCSWQAACSNANLTFVYKGSATEDMIRFDGQNDFTCWAKKEAGGERLIGGCSRDGTEVSQCSARVNEGRLILTPK